MNGAYRLGCDELVKAQFSSLEQQQRELKVLNLREVQQNKLRILRWICIRLASLLMHGNL